MKKCPDCGKWTLDFDDYFGRFRCFNVECGWIPVSSAGLAIGKLRSQKPPVKLDALEIRDLGLSVSAYYDADNDALMFDFGLDEPSFDLPEDDGRMIWKIARPSGSVAGFTILGAKRFGVSEVRVNIAARKENLERALKRIPDAMASGRVTRVLIENVEVTAKSREPAAPPPDPRVQNAFEQAFEKFEECCLR